MPRHLACFPLAVLSLVPLGIGYAQTTQTSSSQAISKMEDKQISEMEAELVPLAEAMPADKYDFVPTGGEFKNVRTFALQMRHVATVIDEVAAMIAGEKPKDTGKNENGPDTLNNKDAIVSYMKSALAHAHKAMATITDKSAVEEISTAWGKQTPLHLAEIIVWHSYDHYGQSVVYLRLNGIVPPASRK